jgi:hypothetical protein
MVHLLAGFLAVRFPGIGRLQAYGLHLFCPFLVMVCLAGRLAEPLHLQLTQRLAIVKLQKLARRHRRPCLIIGKRCGRNHSDAIIRGRNFAQKLRNRGKPQK